MELPEVGDVVHIRAVANSVHADGYGVVMADPARRGTEWTSVEVLIAGQRRRFDRSEIDYVHKERNPFRLRQAIKPTSCRLFVILARRAASAVIFRRGPSGWVQLIKWHTSADRFESGQWFHGRLYELRADLSPSADHLIYFAAKPPKGSLPDDGYSYAWTAISKPPYLTALALWPKRCSGTYFGGGLFIDDGRVQLNHPAGEAEAHPKHLPPASIVVSPGTFDPRYPAGYYNRLQRDGWLVDHEWWRRWAPRAFVGGPRALLEKPHPRHAYRLAMESDVFYRSEAPSFTLQDERRSEMIPLEGVTWADWDQRGRLVYAQGGKLLAIEIEEHGLAEPTELADFNDHRPSPVVAPDWALNW